jgi:hypothetical protein
MSATTAAATVVPTESKSSRRKKGKAADANHAPEEAARSPVADAAAATTGTETPTNGVDGSYESPYIKELYK